MGVPYDGSGNNGVCFYTSTNASIPANWQRVTDFDGKFLQGHATTAGTNGGGSHTHTQSHKHGVTMPGHTHTITASGNAAHNVTSASRTGATHARYDHTHASWSSGAVFLSPSDSSTDSTSATSASADPEYIEVIVIEPTASSQDIPQDCVAFFDGGLPSGNFAVADGTGGTVNAGNRFLKGAAAAGDGGGTGGATTHDHGGSISHSHTHAHDHSSATSTGAVSSATSTVAAVGITGYTTEGHTHAFDLDNATLNFSDSLTVQSASNNPKHSKLLVAENTGSAETPDGVIIGYIGTVGNLPSEWEVCDGSDDTPKLDDSWVMGVTSTNDIGGPYGDNDHTHGSPDHTPTGVSSHTHTTGTETISGTTTDSITAKGFRSAVNPHSHVWSVANYTGTITPDAANVSLSTTDKRSAYRTLLWIKNIENLNRTTVHLKGEIQLLGTITIAGL